MVAGIAKLSDRKSSQQSLLDFSIPSVLVPSLAVLLPLTELLIAIALIPSSIAWWGALAALNMLCVFIVGLAIQFAQGHQPNCHCFASFVGPQEDMSRQQFVGFKIGLKCLRCLNQEIIPFDFNGLRP